MRVALLSLLISLVLTVTTFLGYNSYKNSSSYISLSKELSSTNGAKDIVDQKIDKLLESLSFGYMDDYSKTKSKKERLESLANHSYSQSFNYLYYFFGVVVIFLLIFWLVDREFAVIFISLMAIESLIFALISPLLSMIIYKSFPLLGEVTLSFESKSIITTIKKMYDDSNYLLALLVLSFSILLPFIKSITILLYGISKELNRRSKIVKVVEKIGKWSMADVFIVAILVVFFSTKGDINTALSLQVGLYFFVGYVLLSMISTMTIRHTT